MTKANAGGEEVTLRTIRNEGLSSILTARIDDSGDLVLSGHDRGPRVAQVFGDDEYEYRIVVRAEHVEATAAALVEILKDDGRPARPGTHITHMLEEAFGRQLFTTESGFAQWLTEHEIPSEFSSYS